MSSRIIAGVMKWGKWGANLSTSEMERLIQECVDEGVYTFDHADIYGGYTTEKEWGAAWKKANISRDAIKVITKCGIMYPCDERPNIQIKHYDTSHGHIIRSVENSLKNLETDYIDLLLIHRPSPLMNPQEIVKAMDDLYSKGKVKNFGVSNFTIPQMSFLGSEVDIVANQIEISPLNMSAFHDGTLDFCMTNFITPMAWSPLGGGSIFGNLSHPDDLNRRERLLNVAKKYNWDLDEMIYLFLLHHPAGIKLVVGSSKIERIKTAVEATHTIISDSQWFEIWTAANGERVP